MSENGESDQDDQRAQSDADTDDSVDIDSHKMYAWTWCAQKAAKRQNSQTPTDILNLVYGSSSNKVFMTNLHTLIANHRRLYDYLTQGYIYTKITDDEGRLRDDDYDELEAKVSCQELPQ